MQNVLLRNGNMKLKFKEKRICVFANYRTASTTVYQSIVENNNLPSLAEYFRTTNIGYAKLFPYEKAFRNFNSMNEFALKIMADHVQYDQQKITDILNRCDRIVYTYRRDFKSQALSWLAANSTASYADLRKLNGDVAEFIVPHMSPVYITKQLDMLKNNYITMGEFCKSHPGDIICLDDFEEKNPYTRVYTWSAGKPEIPDFDVEQAIFGYALD